MAEPSRDLVVLITHGADHELSSVAFTIANGGNNLGPEGVNLSDQCCGRFGQKARC